MKRAIILILAFSLFVSSSFSVMGPAHAGTRDSLFHQGVLFDETDNPVTDIANMTFRLFSSPEGGTPIWEETQRVSVEGGLFSAELGSSAFFPDHIFEEDSLYLEMQIGDEAALSPRQALHTVPFANYANIATTALSLAPNSVTSSALTPGSVGNEQLSLTGVTAGTYSAATITVDSTGRITSASTGNVSGNGVHCWDLNASGVCDLGSEDINLDGGCTALDCRGATGPQGPQGAAGAAGAVGPQGPAGADGAAGAQGPAGPQGAQGLQGAAGANGTYCWDLNANGACDLGAEDLNLDGFCTVADCKGATGAQGAAGPQGVAGPQGAKGDTGDAGAQGPVGPQGPQGPAGANGADGAAGAQGPQGVQGPAGADGAQGPVGPQGPAGTAGALTSDWNQSGAFDIFLNNADSQLVILGDGNGENFVGTFNVADLSGNQTYTFPDVSGEVTLLGQTIGSAEVENGAITNAKIDTMDAAKLTGFIPDARLSANVSLLGASVSNAEITDLDAGKLNAGSLADARLSANVSKLGASIESGEIADDEIVNADINASAGIDWSKISKSGSLASDVGAASAVHAHNGSDITAGTVSSSRLDTGTTANKIVQLDGAGKLPAVDGSQLTGLTIGGATSSNFAFIYSTATQTVASTSAYQDITLNFNGTLNGWTHPVGAAAMTCNQTGLYLVTITGNVDRSSGGGISTAEIRALFNGIEVTGSQVGASINTAASSTPISRTFMVNAVSGQILKLQLAGSTTTTRLLPSGGALAATKPSITATIIRVQ